MAANEPERSPDAPDANVSALKDAHTWWAAAYESIRPTGEVDSRAKLVLVSSFALIALCLATDKPDSINVLGFAFKTEEWLILAIPVTLVVVYATVQLFLAWRIQLSKIEHSMFTPIVSIRLWLDTILRARLEKSRNFVEEAQEMIRRREEVNKWYEAQSEALQEELRASSEEASLHASVFKRQTEQIEDLRKEREARLRDAGLMDHEKKVDAVLDDFFKGRKNPDIAIAEEAVKDLRRVARMRKARSLLDLFIPLSIAVIALSVFVATLVSPSSLGRLGYYLSKGAQKR